MEDQNKNMILAIVLSMAVIFGWMLLFPPAEQAADDPLSQGIAEAVASGNLVPPTVGDVVASAPASLANSPEQTRENALEATERLNIETARLAGSISLTGGRLDDLHLTEYDVVLGDDSDKVTLLSPTSAPEPYYVVWGWTPTASAADAGPTPNANTVWSVETGGTLTEETPVTLIWDNGSGLVFRRTFNVDEHYMFDIEQSVENNTGTDIRMQPYGTIARHGEPETTGFYLLHEGVVRANDGVIQEIDYDEMPEFDITAGDGPIDLVEVLENGWVGFTDKYWMTTLVPQAGQSFNSVAKYVKSADIYQTDMRLPVMDIPAGTTTSISSSVFAGAKVVETIKAYEADRNIDSFVDSVDWGWFYFITKPMQWLLSYLHGLIGNMGLAIIGLTLIAKITLFPLAYKSSVSMAKMKKLQPEMAALKERCGDDKQKMQREMMQLYKAEKVSPAAGCLPILIQIPIFFSLYKVLFVTIEMRHAPFFGWIQDLSAPDPSSWLNLFGILPWDTAWAPALLSIGLYPILMGITMWMQQKLNPTPTDKTQAMIFAWMPWVFMFMLGGFASGLVLYWVANNTLTFLQQYFIMKSQGVKPDVFGNIMAGFKKKKVD